MTTHPVKYTFLVTTPSNRTREVEAESMAMARLIAKRYFPYVGLADMYILKV